MCGQLISSSMTFTLLLLLLILAAAIVVEQREENASSFKKHYLDEQHINKLPVKLEAKNDRKWPVVPDPVFPERPHEFQKLVDKSCQMIFYMGTKSWRIASDSGFLKFFGGCRPASRGFCQAKHPFSPWADLLFWKRSTTGVWLFQGKTRDHRPNCTVPPETNGVLQSNWQNILFTTVAAAADIEEKINATKNSTFPISSMKKLPRTADPQLPALWPAEFAHRYSEECRYLKAEWNVNYRDEPTQEWYKNCNFTADSRPYCMEPEERQGNSIWQRMLLRSVSGGYENGGFLDRKSLLIGCTFV